ncbi:MAG: hypothetical protein R3B96_11805 [Pirellulaceae bacterium]|nr:hypothetical protein [Planctomycetales bacterium]
MSKEPLQFHEESPPDVEGYLPFDIGSILALCLAAFSVGTFWVAGFSLLGVLGMAVAWRSSMLARKGKRAAIGGYIGLLALVVAASCTTTGLAYQSFVRQHLARVARVQVESWCDLLAEGRVYEAFELHRAYRDRQIVGTSLEDYYREDLTYGLPEVLPETEEERMEMQMSMPAVPAWQELDMFFETEPARTLRERAGDGQMRYEGLVDVEWDGPDTFVSLRYNLVHQVGGMERETPMIIEMVRSKYQGGIYHWAVEAIKAPARGE